jgi:hypothetical protein
MGHKWIQNLNVFAEDELGCFIALKRTLIRVGSDARDSVHIFLNSSVLWARTMCTF